MAWVRVYFKEQLNCIPDGAVVRFSYNDRLRYWCEEFQYVISDSGSGGPVDEHQFSTMEYETADPVLEIEYCVYCKVDTEHSVQYLIKTNKQKWRRGKCSKCNNHARALPFNNGVLPRDYIIQFGKHAGKSLGAIAKENISYLKWILETNFSENLKNKVKSVINDYKNQIGDLNA